MEWHQQDTDVLNRIATETPAVLDAFPNPAASAALVGTYQGPGRPSHALLRLASAVADGQTVTIGADVYEFDTDADVTGGRIAVDVSAAAVAAQGTLTVDTQPTAGDTMTVGTVVYTFVEPGDFDAAGEISRGTNLATAQAAIVAAINGTDGENSPNPDVSIAAFAADDAVLTARTPGLAGDSLATTETFTAGTNVFDATTLGATTAGVDPPAADAAAALVAAINADGTVNVVAVQISEAEEAVAIFTADAPGGTPVAATSALATTETLAGTNNAWGGATMVAGAASGTVRMASLVRTPTAGEVAVGALVLALPFIPDTLIVQVRDSTGAAKAWDGTVEQADEIVTLVDGGAVNLAATDTVTVIATDGA